MKGFHLNIEKATLENEDYRRVLYTAPHMQLVLMTLQPGEEIGEEVHHLEQFIRFEAGEAKVILDGVETLMKADEAVIIPEGTLHNVINVGVGKLKLYTIYAPPEHLDAVVEKTKADVFEEHFDGKTSE
ncbi:MAG: cupin domain-containing protein [Patescibacteria group bacterium]